MKAHAICAAVLAAAVTMIAPSDLSAIEIVKVEEVWTLSIGEPSTNTNGPQVSMVMSPFGNLHTNFFMFFPVF